jgi:hypothetical protein
MPEGMSIGGQCAAQRDSAMSLLQALHELDARPRLPGAEGVQTHRALLAAIQTTNALLALAAASCTRALPAADVEMETDASDGRLVYRCRHTNPHRWELDGTVI